MTQREILYMFIQLRNGDIVDNVYTWDDRMMKEHTRWNTDIRRCNGAWYNPAATMKFTDSEFPNLLRETNWTKLQQSREKHLSVNFNSVFIFQTVSFKKVHSKVSYT